MTIASTLPLAALHPDAKPQAATHNDPNTPTQSSPDVRLPLQSSPAPVPGPAPAAAVGVVDLAAARQRAPSGGVAADGAASGPLARRVLERHRPALPRPA